MSFLVFLKYGHEKFINWADRISDVFSSDSEAFMSRTSSFLRLAAVGGLLALSSCADMDEQQQMMLSGGAAGAVIGTVGTVITGGCIPCGTVIGGAVGVAGGYIIDQLDKNTKSGGSNNANVAPAYPYGGSPVTSYNNAPVTTGQINP